MKTILAGLAVLMLVLGTLLLYLLRRDPPPAEPVAAPSPYHQQFEQRQAVRQQQAAQQSEQALQVQRNALLRERLLRTPECQFWWQQDTLKPTPRTREKKHQYCDV